jgi:Ca2+:H+ antiporter
MSLKPSIHWLFAFIPVTFGLEHAHAAAPLVFFSAALSIVPIAAVIVHSTEQLSTHTGDAVGGLLNATFGNAPELIIAVVALRSGMVDLVRGSLVGAIFANILLATGLAFLLGGLRFREQTFSASATRMYSSMMFVAVVSLAIPSAIGRMTTADGVPLSMPGLHLGAAAILFGAYVLYLVFMLKTHPDVFKATENGTPEAHAHGPAWSIPRALGTLVLASVGAAVVSEVLVGAAEGTGEALGMSQAFIGMVFLAIVGGAAESGSAIAMGRKNRMDLAVSIALGSCIQIALFVAPVLVVASYFIGPEPFDLAFGKGQIAALFVAVLIAAVVANDGRSNWYKGVQLITVYAMTALALYLIPGG